MSQYYTKKLYEIGWNRILCNNTESAIECMEILDL